MGAERTKKIFNFALSEGKSKYLFFWTSGIIGRGGGGGGDEMALSEEVI